MVKLANAFSLNMLGENVEETSINVVKLTKQNAGWFLRQVGEFQSYVGHPDTAAILTQELGVEVKPNRETMKLDAGDVLIVAQYVGPRLPEGCRTLPEGARFIYYSITLDIVILGSQVE